MQSVRVSLPILVWLAAAAWAQPARPSDDAKRARDLKIPQILEALAIPHGGAVADIGAGDGFYEISLSQAVDTMPHKTITRPRADQAKNHVIAADLVQAEVREAGFKVVSRDDRFIDNPDDESTRWMIVFRKPSPR